MSARRSAGLYQRMLRLYPRRFRDEYGADMVLLFADQLRDESSLRVWMRVVADLAITVPTLRLEAHMNRDPSPAVAYFFATVSVAAVLAALIVGSNAGFLAMSLVIAIATATLALVARRHSAPLAVEHRLTAQWWKFLAAGLSVIVGFALVTTFVTGNLGVDWTVGMLILLSALVSTAAGVMLGVAHLAVSWTRRAAT